MCDTDSVKFADDWGQALSSPPCTPAKLNVSRPYSSGDDVICPRAVPPLPSKSCHCQYVAAALLFGFMFAISDRPRVRGTLSDSQSADLLCNRGSPSLSSSPRWELTGVDPPVILAAWACATRSGRQIRSALDDFRQGLDLGGHTKAHCSPPGHLLGWDVQCGT
ncbi:54S ribosomal protein L3 [Fusarium oxysporum f. sp. albedinis]|nr:54S ribosomal protein L3 [Fusarium oxysporum f. sp. albedinis]